MNTVTYLFTICPTKTLSLEAEVVGRGVSSKGDA